MNNSNNKELVLILDFGGQYKELISRTTRGLCVYSEIKSGRTPVDEIKKMNPIGIILTGGPDSVYKPQSPKCDKALFEMGIPILGICYGMHLMSYTLGGEVKSCDVGEYGQVVVNRDNGGNSFSALMSHRDMVTRLPDGFKATEHTANCIAACHCENKKLYGVQYHPESIHTENGSDIIKKFLYDVCGAKGDYKLDGYIKTQIETVKRTIGDKKVILGLSGGVDSSVCAMLISEAIENPEQLICVFVDHGLMRLNEAEEIEDIFSKRNLTFIRVNAKEQFLSKLKGVTNPETKRKIIGEEFVRTFETTAEKHSNATLLAQGTIYPDVIESGGEDGSGASVIKSHHNVGGIPENSFDGIIEPLSGLFKDEVRIIGKKLGLPDFLVNRQPFPGPGLAVRIMGEITAEKIAILQKADAIMREEVGKYYNDNKDAKAPDQYFAVLTDTYTVGVKGDDRTYDPVIALRAVDTSDFMTCEYSKIPHSVLKRVSSRITGEIPSVSRVVYDITDKPPSTVEWE